ncbi:MAG: transcription termination/antitermination factor NusG [Bacteroidaceae bacterium]|jgi:transcriptional antiterminator NusG|nr:transcription termination/antitermination factor NusG [Bacteroidaceae bacterium]MBQ2030338.1 transcription termination/antitermination factor NusG [Bacteroidaceae bacterium]MBQ2514276.1 transcription termination/antitermination factor NusG [Bacteroidales bacterium]
MAAETEMNWYVLRAITGKEGKVKEYIEAEISNNTLPTVSKVLIPMEKTVQIRNGKRVVKEHNLMSGYVLVQAKMEGETAAVLRNTPNVVGILGGLDKPAPLRQAEINRLLGTVDELAEGDGEIPFVVGETVKVTEGPFSGFSGTIDEINNEKKKLTVMVKVFGRNTPLVLGFMQVEKE